MKVFLSVFVSMDQWYVTYTIVRSSKAKLRFYVTFGDRRTAHS